MSEIQVKERRRFPRVPLSLSVKVDCPTIQEPLDLITSDVSAGGISVETDTPLTVGTDVQLTFLLPDLQTHMEAPGRVVRVDWTEFDFIDRIRRDPLNQLVDEIELGDFMGRLAGRVDHHERLAVLFDEDVYCVASGTGAPE